MTRPIGPGAPPSRDLPRAWPIERAGAGAVAGRGRPGAAGAARATAPGTRDVAEAGRGEATSVERLLGRAPARSARGLAALLPPPQWSPPRGVARLAAALRRTASRARTAGGAGDALARAAAGDAGGALRAALDQERRLGEALEQLGALQDQLTAAMTAVASG